MEGISFDEYLEDFKVPVVIVDHEGRLIAANREAIFMVDRINFIW